jgi:hypothetical protein
MDAAPVGLVALLGEPDRSLLIGPAGVGSAARLFDQVAAERAY